MVKNKKFFGFGKNVFVTGLVSLFMDMSSEMIYPLVPIFLSSVLGVNKSIIGLIEGIAESTASILRVFSGLFSDRVGRRKGFMALGYGMSTLSRPIIALAGGWHSVLAARFVDRVGKGIRTAPRDAIVAESTDQAHFGRAFGFQRTMDTMGAVIGPVLAFFFLTMFSNDYRKVFLLSMIPGVIAVLLIVMFIKDQKKAVPRHSEGAEVTLTHFDWRFKFFVLITALFAFGNSSDAFLILKARQTGIPAHLIPILYLIFNVIYALSSLPAGIAADRFGKRLVIFLGFVLFALVYLGFAIVQKTTGIWLLFSLYGIFMGLTDGTQKAFLASIIPPAFKATAFGVYYSAVGLAMFPASLIGGWLWDRFSPSATFYYGASTACLSSILFIVYIAATRKVTVP